MYFTSQFISSKINAILDAGNLECGQCLFKRVVIQDIKKKNKKAAN
jgi:hypothetical protein